MILIFICSSLRHHQPGHGFIPELSLKGVLTLTSLQNIVKAVLFPVFSAELGCTSDMISYGKRYGKVQVSGQVLIFLLYVGCSKSLLNCIMQGIDVVCVERNEFSRC